MFFRKLGKAIKMEKREDPRSILKYLPLVAQSPSLAWPRSVEQELQTISKGPDKSMVNSGEALALHITNMRKYLSLNAGDGSPNPLQGYSVFFDKVTVFISLHLSSWLFLFLYSLCL